MVGHFADDIYKCISLNSSSYLNSNFTEFLALRVQMTINQYCSDNGLASNRQQAIIRTNDGLVYWHTYTSLGLNELKWNIIGFSSDKITCHCILQNNDKGRIYIRLILKKKNPQTHGQEIWAIYYEYFGDHIPCCWHSSLLYTWNKFIMRAQRVNWRWKAMGTLIIYNAVHWHRRSPWLQLCHHNMATSGTASDIYMLSPWRPYGFQIKDWF